MKNKHINDINDVKAAIVDCFEDYMEEMEISLPSNDRKNAVESGEDPATLAIIYGEDYDLIGDVVEEVLSKKNFYGIESDKAIFRILKSVVELVRKYDYEQVFSFFDIIKLGSKVYKIIKPDEGGPMITVRFSFEIEDLNEYCGKSIFECVGCFLEGELGKSEIIDLEVIYNEDDAYYYCIEGDSGEVYATNSEINGFNEVIEDFKKISSREHSVKILPKWFEDVASGRKTFEIRFDNRNYKVGDVLHLCEWVRGKFTGREVTKIIDYIYHGDGTYGISKDYVILGLKEPENKTKKTNIEITVGNEVLMTANDSTNKFFSINVQEVLERVVEVKATSYEDALEQVRKQYRNCDIVLDAEDLKDTTIS